MPAKERSLIVDNADPSTCSADELCAALGLADSKSHSQAIKPTKAADMHSMPQPAMTAAECGALRDAVRTWYSARWTGKAGRVVGEEGTREQHGW